MQKGLLLVFYIQFRVEKRWGVRKFRVSYIWMGVLSLVILTLSFSQPVLAESLTGVEIQQNFVGTKWNYLSRRNRVGTITYHQNGSITWRAGIGATGSGFWRIEGDKICNKFDATANWRGSPWRCGSMRASGNKFRLFGFSYWN